MERAKKCIDCIVAVTAEILGDKLVGVYVHGSYAFGCFRWNNSDLDYLVVVKEGLTPAEKADYVAALLHLWPTCPPKGLEMSVVLAEYCKHFVHPTPYDLHLSADHLDSARRDIAAYCGGMQGVDPDLTAHFAVTRAVGISVYGSPIEDVFAPVPRTAYLDSIRYDVENAVTDIVKNPVYVTLNLCRALAYGEAGLILSKADGGRWGIRHLPENDRPLIAAALAAYTGTDPAPTDAGHAWQDFATYALGRMEAEF